MMRRWRNLIPFAVSGGLLAWLATRVSLEELGQAAAELNWPLLSLLTVLLVLALYFWDAFCLKTVYGLEGHTLGYGKLLHVRGLSYLAGAFNYELGQGFIAWNMARLQSTTLVFSLSRSVLLAWHDLLVLLSLGLAASLVSGDERTAAIRRVCLIGLVVLLVVPLVLWLLPAGLRQRLKGSRWTAWIGSWPPSRTPRLLLVRLVYFAILIVYGLAAFRVSEIPVGTLVALAALPLVLVADGLPSFAGLGTRETALVYLLPMPRPEPLLAVSLFWSTGMIVVRLVIGLVHLWLPSRRAPV